MKTTEGRTRQKKSGTSLQVTLPEGLRQNADAVLSQIGIDLPTAVRIYLNRIVQTRSIPFPLEAPDVRVEAVEVDEETQERMDAVAKAWKQRKA